MPWRPVWSTLLKERRLYDKATVIVVGGRGAAAASGRLDDATLRVPLLVKQPDGEGAGRRVSAPVQHIDLLPTVLDLVRAPVPGRLRGRSLRPVLDDSDETVPTRPIYSESLTAHYRFGGRPAYALTGDGARLLRDGTDTLDHLAHDRPAESDAGRARRRRARRRARSAARRHEPSAPPPRSPPPTPSSSRGSAC